jgi:uncharacterized membrane protein
VAPDEQTSAGPSHAAAAERLAFFSDAVVAIAITLLAIDLPTPTGDTSAQVLASLSDNSFEFFAFVISFIVIANHWAVHHRFFRWVRRADAPVVGLNLAWLLLIVLTPFLTKTLTEGDLVFARFGMYAGAQALQTLIFAGLVAAIARRGWYTPETPPTISHRSYMRSVVIASGFVLSIPMFPLVGPWAFAFWALTPPVLGRILTRVRLVPGDG